MHMKHLLLGLTLTLICSVGQAQTFADLVESVDSSVVQIEVIEKINPGVGNPFSFTSSEGLGAGVLVGKSSNYILTAAHVVANASRIQVIFVDDSKVGAQVMRIDKTSDLALLKLEKPVTHLPTAVLGDSEKVRLGDDVFVIGSPLGLSHSVSKGIISGKHYENNITNDDKALEFFQTDAAINKGNSGGPMFNMKGEVIGIVSSILSFSGGFEGLGFAATSAIAREILLQRGRVWLGTDSMPFNAEMCKLFNVPQEGAVLVQSVTDNSPAYYMGLKGGYITMKIGDNEFLAGGDFVLSIDGIKLNTRENFEKLQERFNEVPKGYEYKVVIYRAGEIKELSWRLP